MFPISPIYVKESTFGTFAYTLVLSRVVNHCIIDLDLSFAYLIPMKSPLLCILSVSDDLFIGEGDYKS